MKKSVDILLFIIFLLLSEYCFSQTIVYPYEVGTWQGFQSAAISYTFDDNCSNQVALAVPMFDEYGFKLTLFTVTNWTPDWRGLLNVSSNGHEIASHTVSHSSLSGLSDIQQLNELKNSQDLINNHMTSQKCITMAYPNCNVGNTSIVKQFYFAARGCQGYIEGITPNDFMNISSIICGSLGSVKTTADFNARANQAARSRGWCVYLIHGIDNDGGYSPLSSTVLRESLQYLKANQEKFWVSTFGNVAKYIGERNSVSVSESSVKEDSITVKVSDTLDNSYYNYPVTIRRPLPSGWTSAGVLQNGKNVSSKNVELNSVKYIMFDVVPDNGNITLVKNVATSIETHYENSFITHFVLDQNYPNPFNPETVISYHIPKSCFVLLRVYDLLGRSIVTLTDEFQHPGSKSVNLNVKNLQSGVYIYRLQAGSFTETKKTNVNQIISRLF